MITDLISIMVSLLYNSLLLFYHMEEIERLADSR